MELALIFATKFDVDSYFYEAVREAREKGYGLYFFNDEVYLPNCDNFFYFINVTSFIYSRSYEVYAVGECFNTKKVRNMTILPFNMDSFYKR